MIVSTGPGHYLHQIGVGAEEVVDLIGTLFEFKTAAGTGQSWNGGYRYIITEDQRRGTGIAVTTVQNDVVYANLQRGLDILFTILGRSLGASSDAAGGYAQYCDQDGRVIMNRQRPSRFWRLGRHTIFYEIEYSLRV